MEMCKNNFMGEQRSPLKCSGSILVSSANQFVLAVGKLDEFCLTKLTDQCCAIA